VIIREVEYPPDDGRVPVAARRTRAPRYRAIAWVTGRPRRSLCLSASRTS